MALVVTIAGEDRTSLIETDTIQIGQVADSFTFTAGLSLYDEDGDVEITAGSHLDADEITIVDGATTYFGGYVVNQDIDAAEQDSRHLHLQCQGFGIRLNETLVASEDYSNKADDWIINDLFDTYLAAFDSVTHVATIDAGMDISFTEMTLAECLEAICQRTKGRWYIDNDKKVHYFAAESNNPGWFLSDTPEAAAENLITNPIIHVDTTGWATYGTNTVERVVSEMYIGDGSIKCIYQGALGLHKMALALAAATAYYMHCYIWVPANWDGGNLSISPNADNGTATVVSQWLVATDPKEEWFLLATKFVSAADTSVDFRIRASGAPTAGRSVLADALQAELGTAKTSLCYGGRAGCTWQGVAHESKSDRIVSYSYHSKPTKQIDAAAIINRIRIIGADNFAVTRNDATSQAAYGIRAGIVTDQSLETTTAMEERGDDVLDKNKDPRTTYTVSTFQDGAVAGMDIGFRCPQLDIDTEQVIRELNITWWMGDPSYELTLGTHAETSAISRAFYTGDAIRSIIVSPNIPLASRGWSHDLAFSATDHDTVVWAAGTITMAGGVGSFAIAPGADTGNMAATTYIYFDADVSLTALQTDGSAANAVGANKILIAVAKNVAAGKKAIFQVFGGEGTGVLVDTESIAIGAVDTAEIAALAVEAAEIGALAVETGKLALLAVETAQLGNEAVTTGKILARTIQAGDIKANDITAGEIAAGTITTTEILAATIVGGDIAANTIESGNIKANTIEAGDIKANTITAGEIAAGTITTNEILAATILAGDIAANTITANEIFGNTITAAEIAAATITGTEIVAATLTADKLSIGQTLFSNADGLLIFNPPMMIEKPAATSYWTTLRGQQATLSGAIHLGQGRWQGTKALMVEKAATNLIDNPRMIDDDDDDRADGWTQSETVAGAITESVPAHPVTLRGWVQRFSATGGGADVNETVGYYIDTAAATFAEGDDVSLSMDVMGTVSGCAIRLIIQAKTNVGGTIASYTSDPTQFDTGIHRYSFTKAGLPVTTDHVRVWAQIVDIDDGDTFDVSFGAVNVEKTAYATTFIHGNAGDGYAWTNGDDDSTSTRAATEVNLDDHVGLVSDNATMSFRAVVQMPYAHDAVWPTDYSRLWEIYEDSGNRLLLYYTQLTNRLYAQFREAATNVFAYWDASFAASDWLDIIITLDTGGDLILTVDGNVKDTTDASARSPITPTQWNLGSDQAGAHQGGFAFGEYSVLDKVLTAIEGSQLYNLQRPLIDTGATDTPGIYILDGKFRIQSSQTGVRIEITAEEIAGYDGAGTKQFYLQASDGKAYAGGGEVILDDTGILVAEVVKMDAGGIDIAITTAAANIRAYKFELAGTVMSGLFAYAADDWSHVINLVAKEITGRSPTIGIYADAPATTPAYISIKSDSAGDFAQVLLTADSDAAVKTKININAARTEFSGTISTDASVNRWKLKGVGGGTYVGWVGYVEVEINGTTYKLTYGTWT